jgi:ABC-type nitrate/sulfonate/bicarbonate transport system substrate-binding protein
VKFVEVPFASMAAALAAGRVDAATISEPSLSGARATTREIANENAAIGDRWYVSVWFAGTAWLDANTALAHRLTDAIVQTSLWANGHHAESGAILESVSKMPHDVILGMVRCPFGTKLDPGLIEPLLNVAAKDGVIPAPIAAKDLIYPGF